MLDEWGRQESAADGQDCAYRYPNGRNGVFTMFEIGAQKDGGILIVPVSSNMLDKRMKET